MFGYSAKRYAADIGREVRDVKGQLSIVSALRDSDRTGASLKSAIEAEKGQEPISQKEYEALERLVGATKEGRELIDYLEEPAHILWEDFVV